jgi:hypothetical protein
VPPLKEIRKLALLYVVNQNELIDMVTEYQSAVCTDALDYIRKIFLERVRPLASSKLDS